MKKCCLCEQEKSFTEFYQADGGLFGLRGECKKCMNAKRARKYDSTERIRRLKIRKARISEAKSRKIKTCCRCAVIKPLRKFYLSSGSLDGRHSICVDCFAIHKAKYYRENLVDEFQRAKEFATKNPAIIKAQKVLQYAVSRGRVIRRPCEICGSQKSEAHHPNYRAENRLKVQWLCRNHHARANKMKSPEKYYTKEIDEKWNLA